tara:strand:- start:24939 stop:29060 length:4122 start_codon:yes stop_codon:yes gene_type:complete
MPKESLNINDFSGGLNKIVDKRDLQENEIPRMNNFIAHDPGSLKVGGFFTSSSTYNTGFGFSFNDNPNTNQITAIKPNQPFIKFGRGTATISGNFVTLTLGDTSLSFPSAVFPFRAGQQITLYNIYNATNDAADGHNLAQYLEGNTYTISDINPGIIKFYIEKNPSGNNWTWSGTPTWRFVIGAKLGSTSAGLTRDSIIPTTGIHNYVLTHNGHGIFGYYDLNNQAFVGGLSKTLDLDNKDQSYFDTRYLWRLDNRNKHLNGAETSLNATDGLISTGEVFYMDGVARVQEDPPTVFERGVHRRPMGLYYIEGHRKFGTNGPYYHSGWYPELQHCLSPIQTGFEQETVDSNSTTAQDVFQDAGGELHNTALVESDANDKPSNAHKVFVSVSKSNSPGDWQFASGQKHASLRIGISFIYDEITHKDVGTFAQESSIAYVTTSGATKYPTTGTAGTDLVAISSGANDKALDLKISVNYGEMQESELTTQFSNSQKEAIPENRGSNLNSGYNNNRAWNPRIVGVNVYLAGDYEETFESPYWLATFSFSDNETGGHFGHDGSFGQGWTEAEDQTWAVATINNIAAVPVMDYRTKNGYNHNEPINMWYKTSAIVNRKLYAGNISYFKHADPHYLDTVVSSNNTTFKDYPITNEPDKIITSPDANKFDVLPLSSSLQIAKNDGQDIVKLLNFNNELLVFKTNDLVVIDCSGEDEIIKDTFTGKGVSTQGAIVESGSAIYFINRSGLYSYDGQTITDLSISKFKSSDWEKYVYSYNTRLLYDPQYNLILIGTSYNEAYNNTGNKAFNEYTETSSQVYIYNINNQSFMYKDNIQGVHTSGNGFLSNGLNINSTLYAGISYNDIYYGDSAIIDETTFVAGQAAKYTAFYYTVDTGDGDAGTQMNYSGAGTETGYLRDNMGYIKVYQQGSSKWVLLNKNGALLPSEDQVDVSEYGSAGSPGAAMNYNAVLDHITENCNADPNSDYVVEAFRSMFDFSLSENDHDWNGMIRVAARKKGAYYNIVPQDIDSTIDAIYANSNDGSWPTYGSPVDSGKMGLVFSSSATEHASAGSINGVQGNISKIKDSNVSSFYTAGSDASGGVYKITPNRSSQREKNVDYTFTLSYEQNNEIHNMQFIYTTGVNYWAGDNNTSYTYLDDCDSSTSDNNTNDAVVSNFAQALTDQKILGSDGFNTNVSLINYADITTGGSSGSKYIQITLRTGDDIVLEKDSFSASFSVRTSTLHGDLMIWNNEARVDTNNDFVNVGMNGNVSLETKDIDFGQPNIRKKVYKAYITYTGGNDKIKCYYQANQSGSWTAAEVLDANGNASSVDNCLPSSTTQTRAELKFGTGGNNVYSFALYFESTSKITSEFEINDISLIYRMKTPK